MTSNDAPAVTPQPVAAPPLSGPVVGVGGRSVAEVRADLECQKRYLAKPSSWMERLAADVEPLLAEVEAVTAAYVEAQRRWSDEVVRLRGVVQAVEALAKNARPSLSLSPADCTDACQDGDCNCSGVPRVRAWNLDPAAVLAALHPAPLIGVDGLPHHVEVDDAGAHLCLTDCPSCAALAAAADAPQPTDPKE